MPALAPRGPLPPALGALLGTLIAVEHIGARHLVVLAAHQSEFDLVLDVLDMEGAASLGPPRQAAENLLVRPATISCTRRDAPAVLPSTARNAFVMATTIFVSLKASPCHCAGSPDRPAQAMRLGLNCACVRRC